MTIAHDVARAARNLITEHGEAAEKTALARAKNAQESNRDDVAHIWRDVAVAVKRLQGRAA